MNTQMERSTAHNTYEEDPHHNVGLQSGEGHDDKEHHGEKKSVLKKVKDKAKKIKDTIKGHVGHGHELDHGHDEDEDEDDDEMETDSEVHGAPIAHGFESGHDGVARQHVSIPGESTTIDRPSGVSTFDPTATRYVHGQEETLGRSRTDTGRPVGTEEQPYAPRNTPVAGGVHGPGACGTEQQGVGGPLEGILERPMDLEKDPRAPKDEGEARLPENYQSKVTDPSGRGGEEIGVTLTPILYKLDMMKIEDDANREPKPKPSTGQEESLVRPDSTPETTPLTGAHDEVSSGSHGQFCPELATPETSTFLQDPESEPQFLDPTRSRGSPGDESQQQKQSGPGSYKEVISTVTAAVADKAAEVKDIVVTKLGLSRTHEEGQVEGPGPSEGPSEARSIGEYGKKVATTVQEKVSPVCEKVADVGSTVASKVHGTGTEREPGDGVVPDKGMSVKEYLAEKLKPSEEDKALSEVIMEAVPLHKRKELSKMGEEERKEEIKARVTESDEVAKRLGSWSGETSQGGVDLDLGSSSPGRTMLDRFKGAATSWFTKTGESQPSNQSSALDTSKGDQNSGREEPGLE